MTPAVIRDSTLLKLLGDILRPDIDPTTTGAMRLRLMQQGFSWQSFVDLARGQGVLLPLISALTTRGLLPPVPRSIENIDNHVTVKLGKVYRQHLAERRPEKTQLENILLILGGAGIVPLVLKGARYLVEPVASWCEARTMGDFDILVRPSDAERAFAALKAEGYQQSTGDSFIYGQNFSPHLPALQHPGQPVALEIHIQSLSIAGQRIMSTQHVWAHAVKASNGLFFVLPTRWHALHGLLNHQIHDRGYLRRTLNIKALWEWTMLACEFTPDDWDAVRAHMYAARASDVLDSWLVQSQRLFGIEVSRFSGISAIARAHADATFRLAYKPYWIRRASHLADQLRFSFARERLASKYDIPPSRVSLFHAGKNVMDLFRKHRGNVLERLTGYRDRLW